MARDDTGRSRQSSGARHGGGDVETGDVTGEGIAIGQNASARVTKGHAGAPPTRRSRLLVAAGVLFVAAVVATGVLLAADVIGLAVAGFVVAALAVAVAAVPLMRG